MLFPWSFPSCEVEIYTSHDVPWMNNDPLCKIRSFLQGWRKQFYIGQAKYYHCSNTKSDRLCIVVRSTTNMHSMPLLGWWCELVHKSNMSSAKSLIVEDLTTESRSLTQKRRRRGPSTVPWGIPEVTLVQSEYTQLITTRCFLCVKKVLATDVHHHEFPKSSTSTGGAYVGQSQKLRQNPVINNKGCCIAPNIVSNHQLHLQVEKQQISWLENQIVRS